MKERSTVITSHDSAYQSGVLLYQSCLPCHPSLYSLFEEPRVRPYCLTYLRKVSYHGNYLFCRISATVTYARTFLDNRADSVDYSIYFIESKAVCVFTFLYFICMWFNNYHERMCFRNRISFFSSWSHLNIFYDIFSRWLAILSVPLKSNVSEKILAPVIVSCNTPMAPCVHEVVGQATYDAAGDMTCRAPGSGVTCGGSSPNGQTMTYNALRQLAHWQNTPSSPLTQDDFLYDGSGQRVMQYVNVNGSITTTAYLLGGIEESTSNVITKYLGVAGLPSAVRVGSTLSYLVSDGLGSVSEAFDTI